MKLPNFRFCFPVMFLVLGGLLISCTSPVPTQTSPPTIKSPPAVKTTAVEMPNSPLPPSSTAKVIASSTLSSTPTPTLLPGTPLGDGVLTDQVGFPMAEQMGTFNSNLFSWLMVDEVGRAIIVYAGVNADDQEQGELIVVREGTIWDGIGDRIQIPTRSGRPEITDAVGKRLIINTELGDTFYFDVPAGKFAPSLTAILPTMTPGPTLTLRVTPTPCSGDDVTNTPWSAGISPLNQDLTYFIAPGDDEDWFHFYLPSTRKIEISLSNLPAPYSLGVFYTVDLYEMGKNLDPSLSDKTIQIQDAEAGHYYIQVAALTEIFSNDNPYTLRFSSE